MTIDGLWYSNRTHGDYYLITGNNNIPVNQYEMKNMDFLSFSILFKLKNKE